MAKTAMKYWAIQLDHNRCNRTMRASDVLWLGTTEDVEVLTVNYKRMNFIRCCTCGTRWLATNFLSVALWVILDQEGNIMAVTYKSSTGLWIIT